MRLVVPPGVFRPISDTWLLADALDREPLPPGARVLDLCSGSGALAVRAALGGEARAVSAVDVSRRAVLTIRLNAALNGVRVRAVRGDLLDAVAGERFDAIVSNPPYVPAATDDLPARGLARAWDAGRDGRALLDRICAAAPRHLAPGGVILLVHSSLLGYDATAGALAAAGLEVDVADRERGPLGPLMRARRAAGVIPPVDREDILVVRARKAATTIVSPRRGTSQYEAWLDRSGAARSPSDW
jgi:release factor glutamine methyltransferase